MARVVSPRWVPSHARESAEADYSTVSHVSSVMSESDSFSIMVVSKLKKCVWVFSSCREVRA
jgi:hypothetical protein